MRGTSAVIEVAGYRKEQPDIGEKVLGRGIAAPREPGKQLVGAGIKIPIELPAPLRFRLRPSCRLAHHAQAVEEHGDNDEGADESALPERVDPEHVQAVADDLDEGRADHRAESRTAAARQGCSRR